MTDAPLLYEKRNRIAYVTLNRPLAMNALSTAVQKGLTEAMRDYQRDPDLLVAIITGAGGRAFSAGADLKEVAEFTSRGEPYPSVFPHFFESGVYKPIIAAIDGYCVGGGLEVALQCDIRVATAASRFGLPEPRSSLLADYGLHHLSRAIPLGEALRIQLTGAPIDAQRAYQIGLIQAVAPDRAAMTAEAERLAEEIKLCAPLALQAIKHVVLKGRYLPPEKSHDIMVPLRDALVKTEDYKEGPRAFTEKRKPNWRGR